MEKRQKIKRIFCLFSCFLFLCISLVGFIPSVSAFSYLPSDTGVPTNLTVYESLIPFDKLTLVNRGSWTIPSPFLTFHPDGTNDASWIQSNDISHLFVLSDVLSSVTDSTGEIISTYKLTGSLVSPEGVHVKLSTDRPFVTSRAAIVYFFNNFKVRMYPGWNLSTQLTIHCKQPTRKTSTSGYTLIDASFTTTEYKPHADFLTYDTYECFFDVYNNTQLFNLINGNSHDEIIVESISLQIVIDPRTDVTIDKCYSTSGVYFQVPFVLKANFNSFVDFFEKYPNVDKEVVHIPVEVPVLTDGNFLASLQVAVSGFFTTEIMPGLSFGGLLSVAIGIGLVVAFLKHFGG